MPESQTDAASKSWARAKEPLQVEAARPTAELPAVARFVLGSSACVVVVLHHDQQPPLRAELARFHLTGKTYALLASNTADTAPLPPTAALLTARELQIAGLVCEGLLNKQVADQLHISEWTVCSHLRRIFAKLQVTTRAAMVFRCATFVAAGLTGLDDPTQRGVCDV